MRAYGARVALTDVLERNGAIGHTCPIHDQGVRPTVRDSAIGGCRRGIRKQAAKLDRAAGEAGRNRSGGGILRKQVRAANCGGRGFRIDGVSVEAARKIERDCASRCRGAGAGGASAKCPVGTGRSVNARGRLVLKGGRRTHTETHRPRGRRSRRCPAEPALRVGGESDVANSLERALTQIDRNRAAGRIGADDPGREDVAIERIGNASAGAVGVCLELRCHTDVAAVGDSDGNRTAGSTVLGVERERTGRGHCRRSAIGGHRQRPAGGRIDVAEKRCVAYRQIALGPAARKIDHPARGIVPGRKRDLAAHDIGAGGGIVAQVARNEHRQRIVLGHRDKVDPLRCCRTAVIDRACGRAAVNHAVWIIGAIAHDNVEQPVVDRDIDRTRGNVGGGTVARHRTRLEHPRRDQRDVAVALRCGDRRTAGNGHRTADSGLAELDLTIGAKEFLAIGVGRSDCDRIGGEDQATDVDRRAIADYPAAGIVEPDLALRVRLDPAADRQRSR